MDMINSIQVIFLAIFSIGLLIFGIRNRLKYKPILTKTKLIMTSFGILGAIVTTVWLLRYPSVSIGGAEWSYIIAWNPLVATISLFLTPVLFVVAAWYTYTNNPTPKVKAEKK